MLDDQSKVVDGEEDPNEEAPSLPVLDPLPTRASAPSRRSVFTHPRLRGLRAPDPTMRLILDVRRATSSWAETMTQYSTRTVLGLGSTAERKSIVLLVLEERPLERHDHSRLES